MNQHTPGLWRVLVCEGDVTVRSVASGSKLVLAEVRQPSRVLTGDHREQVANATLMAAAPLLLNALLSLLADYYDTKEGPSVVPYFCAGKDEQTKDRWNAAMRAVKAAVKPPTEPLPAGRPTQTQMFYAEGTKIGGLNALMSEMVANGDITNGELAALIEKRPAVYGRFSGFVGTLPK